MTVTLKELANIVEGTLEGDSETEIHDVAEIQNALPGTITFLGNEKYHKYIDTTKAEALIVDKKFNGKFKNLIRVDNVNLAFAKCINKFRPPIPKKKPMIHPAAIVSEEAILGNDIYVGPHVIIEAHAVIENRACIKANTYIGNGARIGADTVVHSNVSIYHHCSIGENNIIHSGCVLGSDGYGFVRAGKSIEKIPQTGKVITGNDVELGANCTIDRGTINDTEIGEGSKLDNQIQIGHNVKVGKYCFFAGQTGIAGSTMIGDYVTIAGQVGIAGHISIGSGAVVAAKSGITKSIGEKEFWFGYPAKKYREKTREIANIRLIPDLKNRLKAVERLLKEKDI